MPDLGLGLISGDGTADYHAAGSPAAPGRDGERDQLGPAVGFVVCAVKGVVCVYGCDGDLCKCWPSIVPFPLPVYHYLVWL